MKVILSVPDEGYYERTTMAVCIWLDVENPFVD
jgi:hypothetical protein